MLGFIQFAFIAGVAIDLAPRQLLSIARYPALSGFFSGHILDFLLSTIPVETLYFVASIEAFMVRLKPSFVTGAVLTPPDPASQLLMAIPLVFLFMGSVLLSLIFEKRRKARELEREESEEEES